MRPCAGGDDDEVRSIVARAGLQEFASVTFDDKLVDIRADQSTSVGHDLLCDRTGEAVRIDRQPVIGGEDSPLELWIEAGFQLPDIVLIDLLQPCAEF